MNKSTMLKKSIISLLILSIITAGLMMMERYKLQQKANNFSKHLSRYIVPVRVEGQPLTYFQEIQDDSLLTTDAQQLAAIAEKNLNSTYKNNPLAVYFPLSSSVIEPQYKLKLLDVAEQLMLSDDQQKWQVVGQTDKSGSAIFNLKLAKARAQNVADFLIKNGVNKDKLSVVTLGEHQAMQLTNSTYNDHLRKVEVIKYQSEITNLATTVKKQNQKVENTIRQQNSFESLGSVDLCRLNFVHHKAF